ncbi:hypothetical protein VTK26DRAFT_4586 [Humicola hyalothermophila]
MSYNTNQAAGDGYSTEQTGTAPAVTGEAYSAPDTFNDADIQNIIALFEATEEGQASNTAEDVVDELVSDTDSLFGGDNDESEIKFSQTGRFDGPNDSSPPSKGAPHGTSAGSPGSDRFKIQAATANLSFPTVDPAYQGNASAVHEEFPRGTSNGNAAIAQAIDAASVSNTKQIGDSATPAGHQISGNGTYRGTSVNGASSQHIPSQTANETSAVNSLSLPSDNETAAINYPAASLTNAATVDSTLSNPAQEQETIFQGFADGSIPKSNFASSILFGPELQKALFTDGEASSDPKLPETGISIHVPAEPVAQAVAPVAEGEIVEPESPQRPPVSPPRLVNLVVARPSDPQNGRGAMHNPAPVKPDTPLADQLRNDFLEKYHSEMKLLYAYKKAYRAWFEYTVKNDNKAQAGYEETAESLKNEAISTQVAWAEYNRSFQKWKAENPAVNPIIDNSHSELKLIKAAEKSKADRLELEKELSDKPEPVRKSELAKFDEFATLMKQSRQRELWRNRVDALKAAQAMIEAQQQALIDERRRIAEDERKKAEEAQHRKAEEERKRAEEERKKAEELKRIEEERKRAEEERLAAEARAAEEAKREALLAKAAEDNRRAVEAADEEVRFALEALAENNSSDLQDFQF